MKITDILVARKKEIEIILKDFGIDSRERIEDILEERENIEVTLRTLGKYKFDSYVPTKIGGFIQEGSCPVCVATTDPLFTPYCSNNCQVHDNIF